jgi:hypothetical protein
MRTRNYSADYAKVFGACAEYCNVRGFPVESASESSGIITTSWKETSGILLTGRAKLNFSVKKVSERETRVVLNITAQQEDLGTFTKSYSAWTGTESQAKEAYDKVFAQIQMILDGTPLE